MVQRKAPKRLSPQARAMEKQGPYPEKPLPPHHLQQDTKKKMKELRSITISDIDGAGYVQLNKKTPSPPPAAAAKKRDLLPNYMKPTTSSDARKELPKVSTHQSPKSLKKKPSLRKPIRPALKRNIGILVCSSMHVNRATCSSTLKDSKFPKALELSPGATEAQGTSAIKVCPYTYCSLNGHRNEGLPPLKCFLASRRKLMRTQKSFRLKGVAQFRKKGSFEEMDTGQANLSESPSGSGLKITPLVHAEEVDDFFVEIYAKLETNTMEKEEFDRRSFREEEVNSNSVVDLADDADRWSDSSVEEMDETMKFLEYVSRDQNCKGKGEKPHDYVIEESEKHSEDHVECESNLPDRKPSDMDSMEDANLFPDDNKSDCYESSDDGATRVRESSFQNDELNIGLLFETESNLDPCGMVECGAEISHETSDALSDCGKEISTIDEPFESEGVEIQNQAAHFPCGQVGEEENISSLAFEEKINEEEARIEQVSSFPEHEIISSAISEGDEAYQQVNFETNSSSDNQVSNRIEASSNIEEDIDAEPEEKEEKQITSKSEHAAEEPNFAPETQNFSFRNQEEEASEEGGGSSESDINETLQFQDKEECEVDEICVAFSAMSLGEDEYMDSTMEFSKNRYIIARRRTTQESEYIREFNPRSPRFLPLEPDPDAEKVDLRHQMMDERKNAEEWMIDYALRKAVNKLAPARKKKVELLVEAFETVIPIPVCEKSVQNETARFRPIQACS
ncbi:uncharacterized protein LOC109709429 [Ananas comosus]|uniref:Uncharacterized protein LOC109709429 n=2 Tax=Ananas comosus TaxID=4615 RepID=A0A6P5F1M0_ANACO|nr:uncharacterized protein LOC109709429 [Ananas comosus]